MLLETDEVPEIKPVDVLIDSPVGKDGLTEYTTEPYPPKYVTGVNETTSKF